MASAPRFGTRPCCRCSALVALSPQTGCTRGCRRRTRSRTPRSTPTLPTGQQTLPGAPCPVHIFSGAPADSSRRSCAWSEKPCLDPLPQTQQCLFFTVRQMCGIASSVRSRRVYQCSEAAVACPPPGALPCCKQAAQSRLTHLALSNAFAPGVPPCPGYDHFPYLCDPDASGQRPYQVCIVAPRAEAQADSSCMCAAPLQPAHHPVQHVDAVLLRG
jgi:hypothetical protein